MHVCVCLCVREGNITLPKNLEKIVLENLIVKNTGKEWKIYKHVYSQNHLNRFGLTQNTNITIIPLPVTILA